jgi:hypothetical protein
MIAAQQALQPDVRYGAYKKKAWGRTRLSAKG